MSREVKVYYNPEATKQHGDKRSAVYTQRQNERPRIVLCIPNDVLSTIPVTKRGILTVTLPDPEYPTAPKFAKGGIVEGGAMFSPQPVVLHSWECIIRRDKTCGRTGDPKHDPWNTPPETTARFWTCTTLDDYRKEHPHG